MKIMLGLLAIPGKGPCAAAMSGDSAAAPRAAAPASKLRLFIWVPPSPVDKPIGWLTSPVGPAAVPRYRRGSRLLDHRSFEPGVPSSRESAEQIIALFAAAVG